MHTNLIDQPRQVRRGEELPMDKLQAYLLQLAHRRRHPQSPSRIEFPETTMRDIPDFSGALSIKQFPSGHSNLTYLLRFGNREWVLRRPPFGADIKTAHDMGREYRILSHLSAVYPKVPRALIICDDESVIGAPFYLMERVQGVILRAPADDRPTLEPGLMHALSVTFIDNLAHIHSLDYQAAGLGELGRPAGYVARQVRGWTERYVNARTDDIPEIERAGAWLAENMPAESGAALIHNDYKYDNLVLDPQDLRIVAVLDWEMATIGDPLMDLGSTLGYWVERDDPEELQALAFGPTMRPGNLDRRGLIERYAQVSGRDVARIQFYYVYGLFKIAVIVQQIYKRFKQGFSQDPRFANFNVTVRILGASAVRAIERRV